MRAKILCSVKSRLRLCYRLSLNFCSRELNLVQANQWRYWVGDTRGGN